MRSIQHYSRTAVILHWLIALGILANVILAIGSGYVPDADVRPMIDLHKSLGITILGLVLLRILWRLTHRPPPLPDFYPLWERAAAHLTHTALYLLILAMPVTGWIHDSAWSGAATHPMLLFWRIPWFRLPFITSMDPAAKEHIHHLFGDIHTYLSYAIYGLVGLHVVAALKHQFIDKQPEIQRMWR